MSYKVFDFQNPLKKFGKSHEEDLKIVYFHYPLKKFGKSHEENLKIESLHFHEIFLPNVDSI